ncbi:nucleolar complex protein 4B-like [Dorcoceras hygrometricum]|uniref:Nucleolar complex protein 4B-like n=1 Tax=Dorcoceras hygrometricum TaxID=472368 RepID=A0A2Z7BTZ8_9LAMI|nr:nucleolar complex protein 4B-like [Dorcoceras hygrometricum]
MASKLKKREKKYSLADLKTLGQQLLTSRLHINNLSILLTFVTPDSPPQHALESLLSIQSFFTPLLPLLPASTPSHESNPDPELVYRVWLRSKFDDFVQSLCDVFISSKSDDALREVALDAVMEFVKVRSAGKFHSAIYHKLLHSIVHCMLDIDDSLLDLLTTKYFKFVDVRYFTYVSLEKLARTLEGKGNKNGRIDVEDQSHVTSSMDLAIYKIHYILSHIPPLEASGEKLDVEAWTDLGIFIGRSNSKGHTKREDISAESQNPNHKVLPSKNVSKKMKLKFTKAWIAFLRLPLPVDVYKEVLVALHEAVIPYFSSPIMLCDFLTRSYDIGGVVSVMALSSLYILMTQHGIEYPNFYDKLYALLEPSIFMTKHRAKFFQLLDSCLKSSLLPAYLAAAFCKKLSRLALCVPPAGALVIVALVHNLLQRHPSINCLINREGDTGTGRGNFEEENESLQNAEKCSDPELFDRKGGFDHFKNEECDPKETNALRSSLWEIDNLRNHYCPPVSRFVLSLENDLAVRSRAPEIAVKDFSSGSYATIFNNEIRRRVKQVPLAFYKSTPTSLFSDFDFPGWTFKFKDAELMNENDQAIGTSEVHSDKSAKRLRTN